MKILRNILFFLLLFIVGFFCGILVANIVDAGKGQMLAGGAIVLGYGVVGAVLGLVSAIFIFFVYKSRTKVIVLLNMVLVVIAVCFWLIFYVRHQHRVKEKEAEREAEKMERIGGVIDVDGHSNKSIKVEQYTQ